jgi:REP element-mobilizing transposase RayT
MELNDARPIRYHQAMRPNLLATMVTTTTYGSWLPGDLRGYVEDGVILPGDPVRLGQAATRMKGSQILFTLDQQLRLFDALRRAADEFKYELTDASIESWHLHWMCAHGYDSVATMVGRLKNRMRQALNIGRIWTEGYYDSMCFDEATIDVRRGYIARHHGCRLTNGKIIDPNSFH